MPTQKARLLTPAEISYRRKFNSFRRSLDFLANDNRQYCFGHLYKKQVQYIITSQPTDNYYSTSNCPKQLRIWDVHYKERMLELYPYIAWQYERFFPIALIDLKPFFTVMEFNHLNKVSIFKDIRSTKKKVIYQIATSDVPLEILLELEEIKQLISSCKEHKIEPVPGSGFIITTTE